MHELIKHKLAYGFLILGVMVMILLYMGSWPNRDWQRIIAVSFTIYYIVWGLITHVKAAHVTKRIVYEYFGIGILGGLILLVITF